MGKDMQQRKRCSVDGRCIRCNGDATACLTMSHGTLPNLCHRPAAETLCEEITLLLQGSPGSCKAESSLPVGYCEQSPHSTKSSKNRDQLSDGGGGDESLCEFFTMFCAIFVSNSLT